MEATTNKRTPREKKNTNNEVNRFPSLEDLEATGSLGDGNGYMYYDYMKEKYIYKNDYETLVFSTKQSAEMKISEYFPKDKPSKILYYVKRVRTIFDPTEDRLIYDKYGFTYLNEFDVSKTKLGLMRQIRTENQDLITNNLSWLESIPHMNLLLNNLFEYNNEYIEYFINWLSCATITREKNRTVIACAGIQRAGKGVMFEEVVFPYIFGKEYLVCAGDDVLEGDWNGEMENKLFCSFNEVSGNFSTKSSIAGRLKRYITDNALKINIKGGKAFVKDNHMNFSLSTNIQDAFKLENSDDRFSVFHQDRTLREVVKARFGIEMGEYIERLECELDTFVFYLSLYDFDKNKAGQTIMTEKKATMIKLTSGSLESLCFNLNNGNYIDIHNEVEEIVEEFNDSDDKKRYSELYSIYAKTWRGYINELREEMEKGMVTNKSLKFLHTLLVEDNNALTDKKIFMRFEKHLGKSIASSGKRYRELKKCYQEDIIF